MRLEPPRTQGRSSRRYPGVPTAESVLDRRLGDAADRLTGALRTLDFAQLPISDYSRGYWKGKLDNLRGWLQVYADLLRRTLVRLPLDRCVLVDYGAGTGIMAMLAKEAGVATVVYQDIYEVSCHDADVVARAVNVTLDHVVPGELRDLDAYLRQRDVLVDVMVSYDVIEHVYDVASFLRENGDLPFERMRVTHASAANIRNPLYRFLTMRAQRRIEQHDRQQVWGHKERDTLRSYASVRRDIIRDQAAELATDQVEELVGRTRGLREDDIRKAVEEYLRTGTIAYRPDHPTNTCDPYTGNWAEHLMEPTQLRDTLLAMGAEAWVVPGYWSSRPHPVLNLAPAPLNALIASFPNKALWLSPHYVLCAEFTAPSSRE